jgi:hypothetical protein
MNFIAVSHRSFIKKVLLKSIIKGIIKGINNTFLLGLLGYSNMLDMHLCI